jgi:CRP-like cAMP-binding protein
MDWVASLTTMTTYEQGRIFYQPEETKEVLFLLKRGQVQLYRLSSDGQKLVINTLGPGAVFGNMPLIGQQMHGAFAEAIEDCLMGLMSRADLEQVILSKPAVALRLLEALGQRLIATETRLEEVAFKGIPARLASLLLRLARDQGGVNVITGYTHQSLAELIGTYRETTTQALNNFKAKGLVRIRRKRLELVDVQSLQRIAES